MGNWSSAKRVLRLRTVLALVLLVGLLLPSVPALAVIDGPLDGTNHPNVGVTYPEGSNPEGDLGGGLQDLLNAGDYCSAVLIAPTLVVTAEDGCFFDPWDFDPTDADPEYGYVSFTANYSPPDQTNGDPYEPGTFPADYPNGKPCSEPCYRGEVVAVQNGFAVLRLDEPVVGITPAQLPAFRSLDKLKKGRKLTTVGYGDFGDECGEDGCFFGMDRRAGVLKVESVSAKRIKVSPVGGTYPCYDDGGGNFLGTGSAENRDVVVALTRFSSDCSDKIDLLRLDRGAARDLLCSAQFEAELGGSPLCGGSASAQANAGDDGGGAADRQHKAKKGGKNRGNGKRGR